MPLTEPAQSSAIINPIEFSILVVAIAILIISCFAVLKITLISKSQKDNESRMFDLLFSMEDKQKVATIKDEFSELEASYYIEDLERVINKLEKQES